MFQQLLFSACILLAVAALDGKKLHGQYKFARDALPYLPRSECEDDRVKCPNSDRCIPQRWFCDGDNDCGDDSDEANCPPVTCSEGQTKCPTRNRCRPTEYFCDGKDDCGDNSDEPEECRSRTCPEGQLKCSSGQCIPESGYCSGYASCRDNTQFPDVTCPHITCDLGTLKCPLKSKCIRSSYFCDGDNDCGDMTDEPDNCRGRSCDSGEFKCNNGQCLNRTALCLSIESYGCKDNTDVTDLCTDVTCPTGYTKCVSDGKCTANSNLCDGSQDCADNSDEALHHCTRPLECPYGQAACPLARRCINTRYFCDTDNDCRDNSDEDASLCSTRTCQPDEVRCDNGQCLSEDGYCSGSFTCRDGSLNDKSKICPNQENGPSALPFEPNLVAEPQTPSPEELGCLMAMMQARQTCGNSPFPELTADPSNDRALYDKLVEMDLREVCGAVQTWFGCNQNAVSQCVAVDNPMLGDVKQMLTIGESVIAYVCVQHIEVFSRGKTCLLKETETGSNEHRVELALINALEASCTEVANRNRPRTRNAGLCIPDEVHSCAKGVVAAQCGDELASALSGLGDLVQVAAGCTSSRVRSLPYSQKQRRAVRQLGSGDEEEFQCMMAIISVRDTCGENPFENSLPYSSNERVLYDHFATGDLRQICSVVRPWFDCIQNAFSSCAIVNNPMIDEPKRMLKVAGVALQNVCVQHVDVINRHKGCLLREASTGARGSNPNPEIGQALQASCMHLIKPGHAEDPLCIQDAALRTCVYNVITAQCGAEIATTLSDIDDSIYAAAGCPARRVAKKSLPATLNKRRGFPFHKKA